MTCYTWSIEKPFIRLLSPEYSSKLITSHGISNIVKLSRRITGSGRWQGSVYRVKRDNISQSRLRYKCNIVNISNNRKPQMKLDWTFKYKHVYGYFSRS